MNPRRQSLQPLPALVLDLGMQRLEPSLTILVRAWNGATALCAAGFFYNWASIC